MGRNVNKCAEQYVCSTIYEQNKSLQKYGWRHVWISMYVCVCMWVSKCMCVRAEISVKIKCGNTRYGAVTEIVTNA